MTKPSKVVVQIKQEKSAPRAPIAKRQQISNIDVAEAPLAVETPVAVAQVGGDDQKPLAVAHVEGEDQKPVAQVEGESQTDVAKVESDAKKIANSQPRGYNLKGIDEKRKHDREHKQFIRQLDICIEQDAIKEWRFASEKRSTVLKPMMLFMWKGAGKDIGRMIVRDRVLKRTLQAPS